MYQKNTLVLQNAFVYLLQPALMRFLVYICLEGFKRGLSLQDILSRDGGASEYVLCLTGRKINYAAIRITFDTNIVQEREKPLR